MAHRSKVKLWDLQSLLGKLNFACRIMPMGRVFCKRLAAATAGVSALHHFVHIGRDHREDLQVQEVFLEQYNGRSFWLGPAVQARELELFTDAVGSVGFAAYFQGRWCADRWPEEVAGPC